MTIDLSDLKVGDIVRFRSGKAGFICFIHGSGGGFAVHFFSENYKGNHCYFHENFLIDGSLMLNGDVSCEIVEIIKNSNLWTDDDMKKAAIIDCSKRRQRFNGV